MQSNDAENSARKLDELVETKRADVNMKTLGGFTLQIPPGPYKQEWGIESKSLLHTDFKSTTAATTGETQHIPGRLSFTLKN